MVVMLIMSLLVGCDEIFSDNDPDDNGNNGNNGGTGTNPTITIRNNSKGILYGAVMLQIAWLMVFGLNPQLMHKAGVII